MRLTDLNLEAWQVRIEQSKGLQDRMVFLSQTGVEALKTYLAIRGPAETDHVFIYRHQPLKVGLLWPTVATLWGTVWTPGNTASTTL